MQSQASAITVGSAGRFGLLGATGVSSTGSTMVHHGNVGSSPTAAVTGFPPGTVLSGILYTTPDPATDKAHDDLVTAYNDAVAAPGGVPGPADLGGATLEPGVYIYGGTAPWSAGTLTLNGLDDPDAEWIFQIGTGLTTPADAIVDLINGASQENVYWQVGSSATLGANNEFAGNILAFTSITMGGGILNGRALAVNGLVSISTAQILNVPEPSTTLALGFVMAGLLAASRRRGSDSRSPGR